MYCHSHDTLVCTRSLRAACFLVLSLSMLTGTRRDRRCPVSSGHDGAAAIPKGCVVLRELIHCWFHCSIL